MNRIVMALVAILALSGAGLAYQVDRISVITDLRDREYEQIKKFTLAAAELMPEDGYASRPTPQIRSFAQEVAHIAMSNSRLCRGVSEGLIEVAPEYARLEDETSKPVIVKALQRTFELCDLAFATLNDDNASLAIATRAGRRGPRGGLLSTVVSHTNEEYGKLTIHLRLKGLVPPSSAPARK